MPKATDNTYPGRHTATVQLNVPKSGPLTEILRGSGRITGPAGERVLNSVSVKSDPLDGSIPVITLLASPRVAGHPSEADTASAALRALLAHARAEGHEAAGQLADLAAQLGYTEPAAQDLPPQENAHELTPAAAPPLT